MDWVAAEVHLSEQGQIFDVGELSDFRDGVKLDLEEAETVGPIEAFEFGDLVLRDVECLQVGESVHACDLSEPVLL